MMYEITAGPRLSLRSSLRMFVKSNAVIRDPRSRLSVGAQKTWPFWFSLIQGRMAVRALESAGNAVFQIFIRSEEHTSELQSLMRISYAVFCLKTKTSTLHNEVT